MSDNNNSSDTNTDTINERITVREDDKDNENEFLKVLSNEEEEDDGGEGFSIVSDDDDDINENIRNVNNEGVKKVNEENDERMEVEEPNIKLDDDDDDKEGEDEGFSIISDDDDDDENGSIGDAENIDGSNELDFIRGIERSDPKKMTKTIIENAQKLMNEKRDKVAQEVTDAILAETVPPPTAGSKDAEASDKKKNPEANAKFLKLKAKELSSIDQNLKDLQELKAGEYAESPSPTDSAGDVARVIDAAVAAASEGVQMQAQEDERAYLIRIGKITPFADKAEMEKQSSGLGLNAAAAGGSPGGKAEDADEDDDEDEDDEDALCNTGEEFFGDGAWKDDGKMKVYKARVNKWKRGVLRKTKAKESAKVEGKEDGDGAIAKEDDDDKGGDDDSDDDALSPQGFDDILIEDSDDEEEALLDRDLNKEVTEEDFIEDDAAEDAAKEDDEDDSDVDVDVNEAVDEHELFSLFQGSEVKDFGNGFAMPMWVYRRLYGYQRVGVQWLWELHMHDVGGILGDEMGLGKTVTIVSFLASLYSSGKIAAPVLVACPATLMAQWAHEFHAWCAPVRVVILHASGSAGPKAYGLVRSERAFRALGPTVFLTTYEGVRIHQKALTRLPWSYVVLDEGHKIKNPDSMVTLACKNFKTPHRVIMSGTPIQNSLRELWSLFDFANPHLLGTLPIFYTHFIRPIADGSFANASGTQAQVAFKSSSALHRLIDPYLLRRVKRDVLPQLPRKREEVLLCALTREQAALYRNFLRGEWMERIAHGKLNMLFGVDVLRKICNHPDLVLHPQKAASGREWIASVYSKVASEAAATSAAVTSATTDALFRSGKLRVVRQLLRLWERTDHKALLFCQTRQMLNIVEASVASLAIPYLRMDGVTSMKARPALISRFNADPAVRIFLLTTKVGGLGVNLTAADRVIIYDPDWNPAVDEQARERVLRIGQNKEVCIYRLLTAGTIEEKVYHRQLFKQSLQNSVLNDVRQKRLFRAEFLRQLFTFNPDVDKKRNLPDTAKIFKHLPASKSSVINSGNDDEDDDDDVKIQCESDISKLRDNYVPPATNDGSQQQQESTAADNNSNNDKAKKRGKKKESETSILKNILSVIDQESITEQDLNTKANDLRIDAVASSIVHETLRSFKFKRRMIKDGDKFSPTWTGSHGETGMPEKYRKKVAVAAAGSKGKTFGTVKSNVAAPSSSTVLEDISKSLTAMRKSPSPKPTAEKRKVPPPKKVVTEAPKMNPGEFDLFNPPPPPPPKPKRKDKRVHESSNLKPLITQRKPVATIIQRTTPPARKPPQKTEGSNSNDTKSPPPRKVLKITDFFGSYKEKSLDEPIPVEGYPTGHEEFAKRVLSDLIKYFMDNDGSLPAVKIIKKFKLVVGEDELKIRVLMKVLNGISVLNSSTKVWHLKDFS